MQLNPRYGTEPIISLDAPPADICGPAVRQRRRLADALAGFTDEKWEHPSRCEGWSGRDVIVHLDSTNSFWSYSIEAGLRGEPTTLLAAFDPVAAPAQFVDAATDVSAADVLEGFVASTDALLDLLASLDDDAWAVLAEAPPGHLSVSAVVHHALWDSWVHERDILLPLGVVPDVEVHEVAACLRYVAALGPALAVNAGRVGPGTVAIAATDPDVDLLIEVDDKVDVRSTTAAAEVRLAGDAVELVEALSLRRPLGQQIPESASWMFWGLTDAFEVESG